MLFNVSMRELSMWDPGFFAAAALNDRGREWKGSEVCGKVGLAWT